MPLTVITLKNSPPSLRGDLTKWMQEIAVGVYVGNFNSKVREELWKRVIDSVGIGEATISYAYRNEIGYNFETHNSNRTVIDYEGIPLVLTPIVENNKQDTDNQKHGFSTASKIRKSKKFSASNKTRAKNKEYVVIDVETTGLDYQNDRIIELGAVKQTDKLEEYTCLIKYNGQLSKTRINLTGLKAEELKNGKDEKEAIEELLQFIGKSIIIGYNVDFDLKFINEALKRNNCSQLKNKSYDIMKFAKQEKLLLENYKLQTVLKEYGINEEVPHRALEDAKLSLKLLNKVNKLKDILK